MDDLDHHIARLAATQHGTFTATQIPGLPPGVIRQRTTSGRWIRHRPGVFIIHGSPDTWERRLWLALLGAGEGSVVGRRAAAHLYGLAPRWGVHIDIVQPEASTPRAKPRSSRRTSRLEPDHVTRLRGLPVTTIERTLFDLAGLSSPQRRRRGWVYVPIPRVERLVDDALVRRKTTLQALGRVLVRLAGRGRPGTVTMRNILLERAGAFTPTESELEDLFVAFLERHGLPHPRRQVVLGDDAAPVGRVDFLFEAAGVVVELDGRAFHTQLGVARQDRRRDLLLSAEGFRVVRLGWRDVIDGGSDLATLLRNLVIPGTAWRPRTA